MYKVEFYNKGFKKMKRCNGIDLFNIVLKKYGKWFLEMCGNPGDTQYGMFK